jgi:hypothetical protein
MPTSIAAATAASRTGILGGLDGHVCCVCVVETVDSLDGSCRGLVYRRNVRSTTSRWVSSRELDNENWMLLSLLFARKDRRGKTVEECWRKLVGSAAAKER